MERRLVKSGDFSYTVSLPKEWITRNNLEKGSRVYFEETEKGLFLTPKSEKVKSHEEKEVQVDIDSLGEYSIIREIASLYLTNHKSIRISGKNLSKHIPKIKSYVATMAAWEVIEETKNSLYIRDFVNIKEVNILNILKRTDNIVRSLFTDTKECLKTRDKKLAETIRLRDKEINKLVFLITKCLNHIMMHPHESLEHGVEFTPTSYIWEINSYLEKMGDEIKRFARVASETKLSEQDKKLVIQLFEEVEAFYLKAMRSLYKNQVAEGDKAASGKFAIKEHCEKYILKTKSIGGVRMVYKLKRMVSSINRITRINRYIEFKKDKIGIRKIC